MLRKVFGGYATSYYTVEKTKARETLLFYEYEDNLLSCHIDSKLHHSLLTTSIINTALIFADGFCRVFPMSKLLPFTSSELRTMICGDQEPTWTRNDVLTYTEPKLGFTRER